MRQWKYITLFIKITCLNFRHPSSKYRDIDGVLTWAFSIFLLKYTSTFSNFEISAIVTGNQTSAQKSIEEWRHASWSNKAACILRDPKFTSSNIDSIAGIIEKPFFLLASMILFVLFFVDIKLPKYLEHEVSFIILSLTIKLGHFCLQNFLLPIWI